jgi:flavin-dependent dehydrogenase
LNNPIVIVGGGPAGSVCAARLAQLGREVMVLEKLSFPRFRLGESLLPSTLEVLDTIGALDKVRARFIEKHGAQFLDDATGGRVRFDFVAAFDAKHTHAFQVPRDEYDALLLEHAASLGAKVRHGWTAERMTVKDGRAVAVLAKGPEGATETIDAAFVVDATGREALHAHARRATERIEALDKSAFYSHFRNVPRGDGETAGDILIVLTNAGWFWLIPFKDGRTSVGAVVSSEWVKTRRPGETPDDLLRRAIAESPLTTELLAKSEQLWPGFAQADFSYRVREMSGDGWLAIGDAGGFIDPLFSTGVHIASYGARLAAESIHAALAEGDVSRARFADFEATMRHGAELFITVVQAFYAGRLQPYLFAEDKRTFLRRAITTLLSGDVFREARWTRDLLTRFSNV